MSDASNQTRREAPLGSKRQLFDPPPSDEARGKAAKANRTRRETLADQRQAAAIYRAFEERENLKYDTPEAAKKGVAGHGVCMCGWTQIAGRDTSLMRVRRDDRWHSYFTGLQKCGLRWVCPVCTHQRGEKDKEAVNDGLAAARARGLFPVMLTLTLRHSRRDTAKELLKAIVAAQRGVKDKKSWRRLNARIKGYARVLEWTWSDKNGHHPHFHMILLIRATDESEAVSEVEKVRASYMRQLSAAGRDGESRAAWERSFQVQGAAAAEQYITKWGLAEELTGAVAKNSMTPWALLRASRTAATEAERQRAAAVWWEIAQATKGGVQLYKSAGWREIVEEWRADDEAEPEPVPESVDDYGMREKGYDDTPAWRQARSRTLAIREAAEAHDDLSAARKAARTALCDGETDASIAEPEPDGEGDVLDDESGGEPPAPPGGVTAAPGPGEGAGGGGGPVLGKERGRGQVQGAGSAQRPPGRALGEPAKRGLKRSGPEASKRLEWSTPRG